MVLPLGFTSLVMAVVCAVGYVVLLGALVVLSPAAGTAFLALNVYGFRYVRRGWTEA